jgi:hypothetical protein
MKSARGRPRLEDGEASPPKAADQLAKQLKNQGGVLKDSTIGGYRVVSIPPIARRQSNFLPGRFDMEQPQDTPMPEVTHAGKAFRDAYFSLQPGSVAVAANQPRTVFYAMTLDRREPSSHPRLYAVERRRIRTRCLPASRRAVVRRSLDGLAATTRCQARLGYRPTRPESKSPGRRPTPRRDRTTGLSP